MPDVFISYANADRERARLLADALTRRGYTVWWDRTIPPGRVFDEVIQEAIHSVRCMIVLWSTDSVRSNWVKIEASEGVARDMLVPALIADVAPPIEFKRIQSANLAHWSGDEADAEYLNLLSAVDRLMQRPPGRAVQHAESAPHSDAIVPHASSKAVNAWSGAAKSVRIFALGAAAALALVGAFWLYGKMPARTHAPANPAADARQPSSSEGGSPADAKVVAASGTQAMPASRGRVNLLSAEQGGQILIASSERWAQLIDGKEETYAWTDEGFAVFGFRDGRTALIDAFAVLVPAQSGTNMKDFELFVGHTAPTGPFESIGRFSTQNMRMMQNPYQEFRFAPVKAKFLKFQSLRNHDNAATAMVHEVRLVGVLQ